jgi:hypothetical protein
LHIKNCRGTVTISINVCCTHVAAGKQKDGAGRRRIISSYGRTTTGFVSSGLHGAPLLRSCVRTMLTHTPLCVCAERSGRRSSRSHGTLVAALRAHFRVHVPDMMMLAVAAHKGHSLTQVARLRGAFFFFFLQLVVL